MLPTHVHDQRAARIALIAKMISLGFRSLLNSLPKSLVWTPVALVFWARLVPFEDGLPFSPYGVKFTFSAVVILRHDVPGPNALSTHSPIPTLFTSKNGVDMTVSADLAISLDGFVAGTDQSREYPLGNGGERLHTWMFNEPDANAEVIAAITSPSAFIMGRNMFGPIRGPWGGDWDGWWGEDPPYHAPVFVLTRHPHAPLVMQGGTTFTFVTDGIQSAMSQARAATANGDIAIAGGASTVRQYLRTGLIDELRLHVAPVLLGAGERLFDGMTDLAADPAAVSGNSGPDGVTHITYRIGTG